MRIKNWSKTTKNWNLYVKHFCRFIIKFGLSILEIFKDSQFNKTKIKHSKIQLQNQTQTLRKCATSLRKGFFSAKVSDTFLSKRFSKGFVRSRVSLMFLIDTRKGRKSSRWKQNNKSRETRSTRKFTGNSVGIFKCCSRWQWGRVCNDT